MSSSSSSLGYAERLSEYPNKGVCGLPEVQESQRALSSKVEKLAELVRESRHAVVLTGAGISTSAGIPDFRGPNGVWTLESKNKNKLKKQKKKKKKRGRSTGSSSADELEGSSNEKKAAMSFEEARPSLTHRALTHLVTSPPPAADRRFLQHIITQNVDGLHRKAGLPRRRLSVLHGCIFTEICTACHREYFRPQQIASIGCQLTGAICRSCSGQLRDTLLDWEDELPPQEWATAQNQCQQADLILCLGTSLRIEPAASLCTYNNPNHHARLSHSLTHHHSSPKRHKRAHKQQTSLGKYVIVNLQKTPYDNQAALVIRGKVDDVMKALMLRLGYNHDWDNNKNHINIHYDLHDDIKNDIPSNNNEIVQKSTINTSTNGTTSTNTSTMRNTSTPNKTNDFQVVVIDDESDDDNKNNNDGNHNVTLNKSQL